MLVNAKSLPVINKNDMIQGGATYILISAQISGWRLRAVGCCTPSYIERSLDKKDSDSRPTKGTQQFGHSLHVG